MIDIDFIDESRPRADGHGQSIGRVRCGAVPRAGEEIHFSGGAADVMQAYTVVRVEWSVRLDPDPARGKAQDLNSGGGAQTNAAAWVYVRPVT